MIEAQGLTKHYGSVVAVEDATFTVRPGEVVGLLGPNGAGKSTIMKMITTYIVPTAGTAKVCGKDVIEEPLEVRKRIGYLPEILPLYMDMEVSEYLRFVGGARGLARGLLRERLDWVKETCGLDLVWRTPIRELSKGYKQRTALAQALVHDPEVVILDEPTSGLDPHQIVQIRKLVRELAREKTVIMSTHILQEVEATADRIIIISRGHIIADGTLDELRRKASRAEKVEMVVAAEYGEVEGALKSLSGVAEVERKGSEGEYVKVVVTGREGREIMPSVEELVTAKRWKVRELAVVPLSLEETFLALTEPEKEMVA